MLPTTVYCKVERPDDDESYTVSYAALDGSGADIKSHGGQAFSVSGRGWPCGKKVSPFHDTLFSRVGLPFPRNPNGEINPMFNKYKDLWWIEGGVVREETVKIAIASNLWRLSTHIFGKGTLLVYIGVKK